MADGSFRPEAIKDANGIGAWMQQNGDAIYNCGYAGWEKQDWGYYTINADGSKVYMIVCNIPVTGKLKVKPAQKMMIEKAYFNHIPQQLLPMEKLDYGAVYIELPASFKTHQPFVITLEIKAGTTSADGPKNKT
jgi:alpha-L-fucosidase